MTNVKQDNSIQTISLRLASLERENRRLKRMGVGLLGASVLFGLLGAASPMLCKTVWAERLVLRNSSNKEVMTMDAYSTGRPTITMRDNSGKSVVRLSWEEGVKMAFLGKGGEPATTVKIDSKGQTTVVRPDGDEDTVSMAD